MTLDMLSAYAQCGMQYTDKNGNELTWSNDSECWHDADWDIMLTDEGLGMATVLGFTVVSNRIEVRLDIE